MQGNRRKPCEKHWYKRVIKLEPSRCKVTILWNRQLQTDKTISNSKPNIIMRDNEKGICHRCCNFRRKKYDNARSREGSKLYRPNKRNTVHAECKNRSDTNDYRGKWNHLHIIQKIPHQHTVKYEIKELLQTAILGTTHILQKVVM